MKLKNKILLPIFTVGATAAVVTPLLTSCGKKITWDDYYVEIPTIEKAITPSSYGEYDLDEVNKIYINHVAENPEIWQQDLRFYHSYNVYSYVKGIMEYETVFPNINFNLRASNVKAEPDIMNGRIYLTFDLKGSITVKLPSGTWTVYNPQQSYSYYEVDLNKFNMHVEHLPYQGVTGYPSTFLGFVVSTSGLYSDHTWYVDANVNGKLIGANSINEIYTYNNHHYRFDFSNFEQYGPVLQADETMIWSWFVSMTAMQYSYHMSRYYID